MENEYVEILEKRDIRPTAIRLLVLKTMMREKSSLSLLDLEKRLDTVDKSTLFRTLSLFLSHHLVHGISDGSGSFKYALCSDDCSCEVSDQHTHFHCEHCGQTFCFTNIPTPIVKLPDGFTLTGINYVLKGLCPECAAKVKNP